MSADVQAWLQIFSGGLVGALVTLCVTGGVYWFRRPRLRLIFSPAARGCLVDTPLQRRDQHGRVLANGQQRVLRLLVENRGRTTAHSVCASAIEISFYPARGGAQILADEVLEFHVALSNKSEFDLAPGAHRWVDIIYCDDFGQGATIKFGFAHAIPLRFALLGFGGIGSYSINVIATAENATAGECPGGC